LGPEEAYQFGLINRIVPKNDLLQTAEETARKIASYNPVAVRKAKEAIVRGMDLPLSGGLELEKTLASEMSSRKDLKPELGDRDK
jgi:enoyl-CoA hydratase/carnithine racemase